MSEKPSKGQQKQNANNSYQLPSVNLTVSNALPNVRSTETILTEFDHNKMFVKRKLENNWSKYDELPEDESNEQMLAANFEDMLLGPKTIGSHFTFNSEKHWNVETSDTSISQAQTDLFTLNLKLLKYGLGALPFNIRQDYPFDFCTDNPFLDRLKTKTDFNDSSDLVQQFAEIDARIRTSKPATSVEVRDNSKDQEVKGHTLPHILIPSSTSNTTVRGLTGDITSKVDSNEDVTAKHLPKPDPPVPIKSIENIQGWLDDILNNG